MAEEDAPLSAGGETAAGGEPAAGEAVAGVEAAAGGEAVAGVETVAGGAAAAGDEAEADAGTGEAAAGADPTPLSRAGDAARAHARAAGELAEYFDRAGDRSAPSSRAEYGVLLAREKSARDQRDQALAAAGFFVP